MKTIKLEVGRILRGDAQRRLVWYSLADDAKRATNVFWRTWEQWHVTNRSADKLREDLDRDAKWKVDKIGDRPKFRVVAIPNDLSKELYRAVVDSVPAMHGKGADTLRQKLCRLVMSRKAAGGNLAGWQAILLDHEGRPSSTRPQPIPIYKNQLKLVPPEKLTGEWAIRFTVERFGAKIGDSYDEVAIWSKGRKYRNVVAILRRIACGEAKHHGGSLSYDRSRRKWFINLTWSPVREAAKPSLDANSIAYIHPAISHPWTLFLPTGGKQWMLGAGKFVAAVRGQLLTQRWNRQANYRVAGSSTKGHGRERALLPIEKLSHRWRHFVKRLNHELTTQAVRVCVSLGIGTIVYVQPTDAVKEKRFLTRAGKVKGREDATGWDYAQVAAMLAYKCKETGVVLQIRKSGEAAKSNGAKRKVNAGPSKVDGECAVVRESVNAR